MANSFLPGFKIGHITDERYHTGCTVILCPPQGVMGSIDVRGLGPGSREAALLAPHRRSHLINAVLLTGGSAFGLAAADGVMRYLAEQNIGHMTPVKRIPIVPASVLFDLFFSRGQRFPDAEMGYQACIVARESDIAQGNVGAGAGVTVGKWAGFESFMKGGFGLATCIEGDLQVSATAVVNAIGDVVNEDGSVLAGARKADGSWLSDDNPYRYVEFAPPADTNTTLVVIATNARLNRVECYRLAERAHDGMAIAIRPVHTQHDGDSSYALAAGEVDAPYDLIANMAVTATATAIRNAVRFAAPVGHVPGLFVDD